MTGIAGAERQLIDLLSSPSWEGFELAAHFFLGAEVDVAALREPESAGRRVTVSSMRHDVSAAAARTLSHGFRRFDVVHTHLVHADWHGLVASPRRTAAWVSTKHNQDSFRKLAPFLAVERMVDKRADRTVAISQALAEFVEQTTRVSPTVVRYGFDRAPAPAAPVREAGPFSLLAAGRLVRQKGFDIAIRALPAVLREFPGSTMTIAGEGPERAALEELARDLGVSQSISFRGWVDDVPDLMRTHDLLVHPARWEGFGLVLLEAMAARLPVAATSAGAIPEVLGSAGRLVPVDRADLLSGAVVAMLAAPAERAALAEAAAERLVREFSMDATVTHLSRLYRSLARPRGRD